VRYEWQRLWLSISSSLCLTIVLSGADEGLESRLDASLFTYVGSREVSKALEEDEEHRNFLSSQDQ
jgi:hypothetical protein